MMKRRQWLRAATLVLGLLMAVGSTASAKPANGRKQASKAGWEVVILDATTETATTECCFDSKVEAGEAAARINSEWDSTRAAKAVPRTRAKRK